MLTEAEIGADQIDKAKVDRARFRGISGAALSYARERGGEAVRRLEWLRDDKAHSEEDAAAIANDAQLYARQAFRGWRAYRFMKD